MNTDTNGIRTIAYAEIEKKFNNANTLAKYKKFVGELINKRNDALYNSIPCKPIYYTFDDMNNWFTDIGIDKNIIKDAIKNTYYAKIASFNPRYAKDESTIAILCVVRYFLLHNKETELNLSLVNLSISGKFYPSIFYKSFKFPPNEHIMTYVVNKMLTNKYDIIRTGSVIGTLKSICAKWIETYKDRFESFNDEDVCYLLQQLHGRIDSFLRNIRALYYEAMEHKNLFITYDSDDLSDDNYHIADNDSFKITTIVNNALNVLTSKGVDYVTCKRASNDLVKLNELAAIIENLISNKDNIPLLKEFISNMVALYFRESKFKDITDISFISYSIRPMPNSKDPYILRKKELINLILINNSENFQRRRNRLATEAAYYRSINAYISLIVQKANK